MKKMTKYALWGIAFISFGLGSLAYGLADNVDPITGKEEPNRSCLQKDSAGKCFEWKILVGSDWMVERACVGPCSVRLERESDGTTQIKAKQCDAHEICRVRLPL